MIEVIIYAFIILLVLGIFIPRIIMNIFYIYQLRKENGK